MGEEMNRRGVFIKENISLTKDILNVLNERHLRYSVNSLQTRLWRWSNPGLPCMKSKTRSPLEALRSDRSALFLDEWFCRKAEDEVNIALLMFLLSTACHDALHASIQWMFSLAATLG
ncbi:hypothetical protein GB937_007088 [Aspergillus fischeri]|nr:hypothetical protein GB937_007088 [Aspergillus fischeri]